MSGNGHGAVGELQHVLERPAHPGVLGDAAQEQHGRDELLALAHGGLEVPGHGIAEPGDDIVVGRGDLLEVDHVALGEDAAAAGDGGWGLGLEGDGAELLDREVEARRLLVEEGTGAGGTGGVHGEIRDLDPAALLLSQRDELGVLAAHLDDGPGLGMESADESGLTQDLVDEEAAQGYGHLLPAAAGDAAGGDPPLGEAGQERRQFIPQGLDRVALDAGAGLGKECFVLIDDRCLDADRADVDPKKEVLLHTNAPPHGDSWYE